MKRCKHCGQHVANYSEHLPMCEVVRAAFDDQFYPGWVGHFRLDDAEHASRAAERYHGKHADKKRRAQMDAGIAR